MIERHRVSDQRSLGKNATAAYAGLLAFFVVLFLTPLAVHAAGDVPTLNGVIQGTGIPMVNLTVFLLAILRVFFGLLGVIALALMMYGGFIWMTASGDPNKVETAKQIIKNTVIGLIIIFSAFAISSFLMAWLQGFGGGGGGGGSSNIPGGGGDWGRSAIGGGPIQSVYPAPNAVNVPINTRIAVTFKVNIKPDSICKLNAGDTYCNGNEMQDGNIEICEISATSSTCLANSAFNIKTFASTTVYQATSTDQKTFIFSTRSNLGNEDQVSRAFMVKLKSGIIAVATNKSVFDNLRVNYYSWAFKTNGILDLTPPEVARLELYPNPDNQPDSYATGAQSTTGSASITASAAPKLETPAQLNGVKFTGAALTGINATKVLGDQTLDNYLKLSTAGFGVNSPTPATLVFIVSGSGDYITFDASPDAAGILGVNFSQSGVCAGKSRCLLVTDNKQVALTGSGIIITSNGNFADARGSRWSFTVSPAISGDIITLSQGTTVIANFIFADSSLADQITKSAPSADSRSVINTNYYTIKPPVNNVTSSLITLVSLLNSRVGNLIAASTVTNSNVVDIAPKAAGQTGLSLAVNSAALTYAGSLSGAPRVTTRTPLPIGSKGDPYNNSIFRVSFTEAVNPINLDAFIKVRIDGHDVNASTTFTNQYKTVELMGTHPCGVNSCGKQIYCWIDPNSGTTGSIDGSTEIFAATLKTCVGLNQDSAGNEWCKKFGGTCTAGSRCQLPSGLNYPQAIASVDGIVDMANNSFNGNFDRKTNAKGVAVGNGEGKTGTGAGQSGQSLPYTANDASHFDGLEFSYANDGDAHGDNFFWRYFVSTQIDTAAPLLSKIIPIGDYSLGSGLNETFRDPVHLVFNGLMRMATLQPGWGYGDGPTDPKWNTRYLILKTITSGANPVGYWVGSANLDNGDLNTGEGRGDGLADYTVADVNHNPFDQAVSYGPLAGNGVESITQNCFLPGSGPINANADDPARVCKYNTNGTTAGCVTDEIISPDRRVTSTNPSSYGYMNCRDVDGAVACASTKICKVHNATSSADNVPNGSWVITKDHPQVIDSVNHPGVTGCCFGKCF